MANKLVAGNYEASSNILHLHFPEPVVLRDEAGVEAFFREVVGDWIDQCKIPPHLMVDYSNLHIMPQMTDIYAEHIKGFQPRVLGTYRHSLAKDFTGIAVSLGNMKLLAPSNIYEDEAAARQAIRDAEAKRKR